MKAILLVPFVAILVACPNRPCSVDPSEPFAAVGTIECPEDQLCLRGECVYACDLSVDGRHSCQSADDCDSSLAFCKNGHCTACPEGTACVPTIGVCRAIELEPPVDPPVCARDPNACEGRVGQPYPLDGGSVYEGIDLGVRDTGGGPVEEPPPTHAGYVGVSRRVTYDGGPSGTTDEIRVAVYDLLGLDPEGRRWRADLLPPRLAEPLPDGGILEPPPVCVLQALSAPAVTPDAIDFDTVEVVTGTIASYTMAYDVASSLYVGPLVPPAITRPSVLFGRQNLFTIGGPGRIDLGGRWPLTQLPQHVPYALVLTTSTATTLAQGIEVGADPRDVVLRFLPYRCRSAIECDPDVSNIAGETVRLTVRAPNLELRCEITESTVTKGELLVPGAILAAFRDRVGASGDYPLVFERVGRAQLEMPSTDALIELIVAVSNSYDSRLRIP